MRAQALNTLFFSNNYDWKPFVIAMVASVVGMLVMGSLEVLVLQPLLGGCIPYFRRRPAAATVPSRLPRAGGQAPPAQPGMSAKEQHSSQNGSMYASSAAYSKE